MQTSIRLKCAPSEQMSRLEEDLKKAGHSVTVVPTAASEPSASSAISSLKIEGESNIRQAFLQ